MLENKEKEIESLTKELTDMRSQIEKNQIDTDVAVSEKLDDVVSDLVVCVYAWIRSIDDPFNCLLTAWNKTITSIHLFYLLECHWSVSLLDVGSPVSSSS